VREFLLTGQGIELVDIYTGPAGVLTGTARTAQEAREKAEALLAGQELERRQRAFENKRTAIEPRIAELHAELSAEKQEMERIAAEQDLKKTTDSHLRMKIAQLRMADERK
jgi:circadian clock protein KaiC